MVNSSHLFSYLTLNAPIEEKVPPNIMTLKRTLIPLLTVITLLFPLLTSCSDDSPAPNREGPVTVISNDMPEGLPLFLINIGNEDSRFRVNTDSPITFESYKSSSHIEMNVVKENGIQYLVPKVIAPLKNEYEVFTDRVINLEDRNIWRNILILVHDGQMSNARKTRDDSSNSVDNADGAKKRKKTVWYEGGGLIKYHYIWPAFSTKLLPINQINNKTVVHPKKY